MPSKTVVRKSFVLGFVLIFALYLFGQVAASPNEPFGDPKAVRGGVLNLHTSEFPKSFNYYINTSVDASQVFNLVYESLMELDPNTLEYQPVIAESITVSANKKEFTVKINPLARWADGKPITVEDIKFTYDTIMNPKNLATVARIYYGRFNPPKIIDRSTIVFTTNTVHYKNMEALAGLNILPKHLFEGKDFNKSFNMSLPGGSGPYELTEVKEGRYYTLQRKKNYWADQMSHRRGTYNFETIKFKVMNRDMAFEAFKKGEFDIFDEITAKRWVTETNTEPFKKNWIIKQKIYNYAPRGFGGIALNTRRPIFKDVRIRKAINHLLDRQTILKRIMFDQYRPLTSYFPSLYSSAEKPNQLIEYNPALAKQLLQEAGFNRLGKDGYLVNAKGERLEFTISYTIEDSEKYLTIFTEACKRIGVKVNLERLSWATLIKKMDEYDFDGVEIAWSAALFTDPEQLWHSKHLAAAGGSNLPGYSNPKVDQLIATLPPMFDINKRNEIIKQIDSLLYQDYPYVLYWEAGYSRILYKNIFGMPKTVFPKYSSGILKYWWIDPVKAKRYSEAVRKKQSLPGKPEEVYFDQQAGK